MSKNIQIPYDLFLKMMRYFCNDEREYEDEIRQAIEEKIDRLANRQRYEQAMLAKTDKERRELLQEYYDNRDKLGGRRT